MITACDTQDFVPFGRDYMRQHPGKFQIQVQNAIHTDPGLPFLKSFKDISIHENGKKEQWIFYTQKQENGRGTYDEELYINGNTVIWSKGGQDGSKAVIKTFTMDSPVIQALWCTFILTNSCRPEDVSYNLDINGDLQSGICVVESGGISCFMDNGSDYIAALPFQVAHAWVIKNGLLFERTVSPMEYNSSKSRNAPNQTTVFSMLHPLDEVNPVITKTGSGYPKTSYLTDNTQHIVYSSVEFSIILTYDTMVGVHSAWKVRRASEDECTAVLNSQDQTNSLYQMGPCSQANLNQSSSNYSRLFGNQSAQSPNASPMRSYSGRISSPAFLSRSQSPLTLPQPGFDRRSQSPLPGVSMHGFPTPSPKTLKSPGNLYRTPVNMSQINESYSEWVEPISPEICLQHMWTEPAPAIRDGSLGKSSKAFLTRDLCGQHYLCYVISYRQQLRCVKFEDSNDLQKLVFGAVSVIPCKDAVPVASKDCLVVLDTSGNLFVYSGVTKLNRLHIPTYPFGNGSISMLRPVTPFQSPVRGGVFTSSRPPSALDARFDEEFPLNQLSPVPTELEESGNFEEFPLDTGFVQGVKDNVDDRFTIELTNGHMCRTSLPQITDSPGIDLALKALKHMLPKDLALQMVGKWYTSRNSPSGAGNQSEWVLFTRCLLGMMGYDTARLTLTNKIELDASSTCGPVNIKRAKTSEEGTDEDWENLLKSDHHKCVSSISHDVLQLSVCTPSADLPNQSQTGSMNVSAILFAHIPACFMALHLVYEELKLNTLLLEELHQLSEILYQLSVDLLCNRYMDYYRRDFPNLWDHIETNSQISAEHLEKMTYPAVFNKMVPSVLKWIINNLEARETGPYPYIPFVCNNIQNVISLYALLIHKHMGTEQAIEKCLRKVPPSGHRAPTCDLSMSRSFLCSSPSHNYLERVVLYMTQLDISERNLMYLPVGISLPLREAIFNCRCNPPSDWPEKAYALVGREDISKLKAVQEEKGEVSISPDIYNRKPSPQAAGNKEEDDGMEHLDLQFLRLRFSEDLRIEEARRLLQSSRPARIALIQKPEVSDHDFIEQQERHLYAICIRTMALPIGRGMFTLNTYHPLPTEVLPIPKLCLTGKAPPRNTSVDLSHIDTPPNMTAWPLFHNGVAAGLGITNFSQVDSSWIIYNRPKSNELTNEYAGFLMALGLNGLLVEMHTMNKHDYFIKGHEMTTIGLLIGLAANKRGTMDLATMKIISIHLPAMLPPTSTELCVTHGMQVAAVLGVGLVFQGSGHRHTADTLLAEIGRPPGPEMENCTDRESYSLAAGLALGLVMFGKGQDITGTSDLSMADTLYHFMVGGHKRPMTSLNKERYKTPSYQIKEGDSVNVDVTAPGAILALGMLYFNTKNSAVAEWLKVPDTQFMLDQVRHDFLLLRTLARGLVMWDTVLPSFTYLQDNIPQILKDYAFHESQDTNDDSDIDYETMSQAYCNVIAGACMVIGLKFAGTANQAAFNTLMECMTRSLKIISIPALVEQPGKSTVENCMMTILISMAMVMAGTGNLEVLRMCRMFRSRICARYNLYVMYGSHMAISMALGLLFLGGGKYTLSTKEESIAVMLCAFFPKFPTHSNDNRYHLQAFRHLYVLAAELRTVLPKDVDTGIPCYVPVEVIFKDTEFYKNESYITSAPCALPDLKLLQEVKILGPRYWPIVFRCDKNWDSLKMLLKHNGTLYVKQRAGHLSYVEDPKGYRSILAKSLTVDHSSQTSVKPDVIKAFTSAPKILALTEYFFGNKANANEDLLQVLSDILYECVTMEKPEAIPSHIRIDQVIRRSDFQLSTLGVSQLKLIDAYYNLEHSETILKEDNNLMVDNAVFQGQPLLKPEFITSIKNRLKKVFDKWQNENSLLLLKYLKGEPVKGGNCKNLSALLSWYDIPIASDLNQINIQGAPSLPSLHEALPQLQTSTLMLLLKAWTTDR